MFAFIRSTHTVVGCLLSVYVGTHACTHSYRRTFVPNEQRTAAIEIAYLVAQRTLCGAKCLCIPILLWFRVRLLAGDAVEKYMPLCVYAIQFLASILSRRFHFFLEVMKFISLTRQMMAMESVANREQWNVLSTSSNEPKNQSEATMTTVFWGTEIGDFDII